MFKPSNRIPRGLALIGMVVLWMLGQSLATAALAAMDNGHYASVLLCVAAGTAALYGSWRCWWAWCWKSQVRPMATYRLGR